ncbi:hypothetical protein B0T10DRAFT_590847, partial [Thelonectria olida]
MEVAAHARRRKACDFCVSRKIKCDTLKPTCSNCRLYGVECRITNATNTSRRKAPAIPPPFDENTPAASASTPPDQVSAIEARLANIESQLAQLVRDKRPPSQSSSPQSGQNIPSLSFKNFPEAREYTALDMWNEGSTLPCIGFSPQPISDTVILTSGQLELPTLPELLPNVDNYFHNYNRYIPLFEQSTFMRMLLEWYSSPSRQAPVPWAAINVVLAISYRVIDDMPIDDPRLAQCIRNLHSATTHLMAWNQNFLGLQVLLGMVILFQGTTDPQLAIVLIGSSMRLIQSMGLPSRRGLVGLSSSEALQRCRIFWIAYVLDRDLALRSKAPYTQLDGELDLNPPPEDVEDGTGFVTSSTDSVRFNYFRARVDLAVIQGKAHDILYSRRAQKLSREQRLQNISRVEQMLLTWRTGIPAELLTAEGLYRRLSPIPIHLMMNMYNRHLECLFRIHSIFSFDQDWLNRVRCYLSPMVIELREDEVDGEVIHSGLTPLPRGWTECVEYCRLSLEILTSGKQTEYSIWLNACCTVSSLIVLLVNIIEFPDHEFIAVDQNLIDQTRGLFEQMNSKASEGRFFLLQVAQDLDRRARGQVNRMTQINNFSFLDA